MKSNDFVRSKFFDFYDNVDFATYQKGEKRLQVELIKLQHWVINNDKRVAIVFEGRDAAGKGGSIKRFTEYLMPKHFNVVELGIPTPKESKTGFAATNGTSPKRAKLHFSIAPGIIS